MREKKGFEALESIRKQAAEFSKLLEEKEAAHQEERQRRQDDHALFAQEMKRIGVTGQENHENDHDLFAKEMQRLGVTALKGLTTQSNRSARLSNKRQPNFLPKWGFRITTMAQAPMTGETENMWLSVAALTWQEIFPEDFGL